MADLRLPILFCLATAALLTAPAMAEGDKGCDEGWSQSGSRCFKFFDEKKSWANAEKSCHTLGANLPSIHSEEENSFIADLIIKATGSDTSTWIGGNDAAEEGKWLWSDGSPWGFTAWHKGEPNNAGGNEHCVMMNYAGHVKKLWNDFPNSHPLSYICAKDVLRGEPKIVSLTLEGFKCQCTPEHK